MKRNSISSNADVYGLLVEETDAPLARRTAWILVALSGGRAARVFRAHVIQGESQRQIMDLARAQGEGRTSMTVEADAVAGLQG